MFARGELGGDLRPLRRQLSGAVGGVLLRFRERLTLLMHGVPAAHLAHEAPQTAEPARRSRHGGRRGIAFRGVVLLLHHLDALMQVAAGLQQIVVRFLYFVLREFHLRLGQIEPVLDGSLVGVRSLGERAAQALDLLRVMLLLFLGIEQTLLDLNGLGAEHRRMRLDVADRGAEGQVQLVIGELHRRLRQRLLLGGSGEARQAFGRQERVLIDDGHRTGSGRLGCGPLCAHRDRSGTRGPQPIADGGQENHEHRRAHLLQYAHAAMMPCAPRARRTRRAVSESAARVSTRNKGRCRPGCWRSRWR